MTRARERRSARGAIGAAALALLAGGVAASCTPSRSPSPPAPSSSSSWPSSSSWSSSSSWPSPPCRAKVSALLAQMTLAEKLGQMVQAERKYVAPGDIVKYGLGSILSGGGSAPGRGTPAEWADMVDRFHAEARSSRLKIPLVYGVDAVHGHNNVLGATIFPHAIGLGCTRDAALVEEVARATAMEVAGTGVDWTFAPLVGPGRDPRWGRTYETFSEDPAVTRAWVAAWLPGSEGGAVADVLFGDAAPTGKLAHSWPRRVEDLPGRADEPLREPLFPFGYGLAYARATGATPTRR